MALIAGPIITRSPFSEPDCHDYFSQSLPHSHPCRAFLAGTPSMRPQILSLLKENAPVFPHVDTFN